MVCCGLDIVAQVFDRVNPDVKVNRFVEEGESISSGSTIAELRGPFHALLTGERVALNFLQRLSGIATLTRSFSDAISHTSATLLDTRKTTPGWRSLEKNAVLCGGGSNHRMGLFDQILIKENHIVACGGIRQALEKTRAQGQPHMKIEIEVRSLNEFEQALDCTPDMIMLDNMSCDDMRRAVELNKNRVLLEASGNVSDKTITEIAETGVDFISVGALTHSAPAADISMLIEPA
jgi:nicotinate-nucleotide pyrophosphorylase (carboxylating)